MTLQTAFTPMKKNLQNQRPKNKYQILKEINLENIKLRYTIKQLQKESLTIKKLNHDLQKKKRELELYLRITDCKTLQPMWR